MKEDKFNSILREYARTLSPLQKEQDLISKIYQSFNDLLGVNNCIQIGSYPRFTSVTPVHDLDVLYFLGNWDERNHNPSSALQSLNSKISKEYKNPTAYSIKVSLQTHSVTVAYLDKTEEIFSVDIVPAYIFSKNEFSDDTYKVPEIITQQRGKSRVEYYQKLFKEHKEMGWISSDPRGYIKVASQTDKTSGGDFRKAVKIVKTWKYNLEKAGENLKLKSFHLEQVVTKSFQENPDYQVFDAIYNFFVDLAGIIGKPNQIKDRANADKFIDDYLAQLAEEQKNKIIAARNEFLVKLEKMRESDSMNDLMEINFYYRIPTEQFLFDDKIKVFTEPELNLRIDGYVKPLDGFASGWISESVPLQKGITCGSGKTRKIKFEVRKEIIDVNEYRWKVRNSDDSSQPRGEITIGKTKNDLESTQFISKSYVECYAIIGGKCVAKHRINVNIV